MKCLLMLGFLAATMVNACYGEFIGVSFPGSVYRINEVTGSASLIKSSTLIHMNSLASDSHGRLYTVGGNSVDQLAIIDPQTGNVLSTKTLPIDDIRAAAFSPADQLFAIHPKNFDNVHGNELTVIDVQTTNVTSLGLLKLRIQAMAFSKDGTLFGWDVGVSGNGDGYGLVKLATDGSGFVDINPQVGTPGADIESIEFAPDGTLYGARNRLFTIDVTTGQWTPKTSQTFGWDIRGIAYVPEPSTLVLAVSIFALLAAHRRRRG